MAAASRWRSPGASERSAISAPDENKTTDARSSGPQLDDVLGGRARAIPAVAVPDAVALIEEDTTTSRAPVPTAVRRSSRCRNGRANARMMSASAVSRTISSSQL